MRRAIFPNFYTQVILILKGMILGLKRLIDKRDPRDCCKLKGANIQIRLRLNEVTGNGTWLPVGLKCMLRSEIRPPLESEMGVWNSSLTCWVNAKTNPLNENVSGFCLFLGLHQFSIAGVTNHHNLMCLETAHTLIFLHVCRSESISGSHWTKT